MAGSLAFATQGPAVRYAITTNDSGWVRLQLTPELQRQAGTLWLSDAQGGLVPFLTESTEPTTSSVHSVDAVITGRDESGRPTIEFTPPSGAKPTGQPPVLRLEMASGHDWAARLQISRRVANGAWLSFEPARTESVYTFNQNDAYLDAHLPSDGTRYRVTLVPIAGTVPVIIGATVRSESSAPRPSHREPTTVRPETGTEGAWRLSTPIEFRIQAIELEVAGTFAPVSCEAWIPLAEPHAGAPSRSYLPLRQSTLWNLPALATSQLTVRPRDYPLAKDVVLQLPPGTRLLTAHVLAMEERWVFPAEANHTYYLHAGSTQRVAPGNLALLSPPSPGQLLPEASLGAPQPDPDARPATATAFSWESVAKILPWFVTLAVGLVGWAALRLLRKPIKKSH